MNHQILSKAEKKWVGLWTAEPMQPGLRGIVSCGWVLMSIKVWVLLEFLREALVHYCCLPHEFSNASWRVKPWHADFLELNFLKIVFPSLNLFSPSFETSLQLTNLVNIGCVYAQATPSHSTSLCYLEAFMGPEQRAELSRTEFKKQMGQFNKVGQINCNMFWLPELGSSQMFKPTEGRGQPRA